MQLKIVSIGLIELLEIVILVNKRNCLLKKHNITVVRSTVDAKKCFSLSKKYFAFLKQTVVLFNKKVTFLERLFE